MGGIVNGCRTLVALAIVVCCCASLTEGDEPAKFVTPRGASTESPATPSTTNSQLQLRDESPKTPSEPATFNGVQLGVSTSADVAQVWGQPKTISRQNAITQHVYDVKPFERVEVTLFKDRVVSIVIHLKESFTPDALAEELGLTEFTPVKVSNEQGTVVGQSYPERGVAFSFRQTEEGPQVTQLVLDTLEAEPFVLRAESRMARDYRGCLDDLDEALRLDPESARAHALRSRVLNNLGRHQDALADATQATQAEPDNQNYQLTRAAVLVELGDYDLAVALTQKAINASKAQPDIRARAVLQLGDLVAAGPKHDYKLAMDHHLSAIKIAQSIIGDKLPARRKVGREVMVDAHLAVAADIAFGYWKMRQTIVPKWLDRAAYVAQQTAATVGASSADDAFRINARALTACVGLEGQVDPTPWAERLLAAAEKKLQSTNDPLYRQHVEWELGCGLYDAMQTCVERSEYTAALKYGELAAECFEHASPGRQSTSNELYLLGRLYFRMGSIHAVQQKDHKQAIVWFNKAAPVLTEAVPTQTAANPGRAGETLVSMGVSYWSAGEQEKALFLTHRGLEWMQQAVEAGTLEGRALAVPYSNLAAMHRYLGQTKKADGYQEMAARLDPDRAR